MSNAAEAPGKRRCKGKSKRGEPCRASVVGASGYCAVHDPERPIDMRELGRRGGKARSAPNPARVHPSLREYLRAEVAPSEVWAALKLALEGQNESARVAATRVLMDALHVPEDRNEDQRREAAGEARAKLDAAIARISAARLPDELDGVVDFIAEQYVASGLQVPFDVTAAKAEETLRQLVQAGLIAPPDEAAELARLRAEVERLELELARIPQAVREEFTAA